MSHFSYNLMICATFLFNFLQTSPANNIETDRQALLDIKTKITHDPLNVTTSWNDTLHICDWPGVVCGQRHRRVVMLDLKSSKLIGQISPSIGNLSFLRELHLENNSFIGEIPSEIGQLHRLEYLSLYNNSIEGEFPTNISRCTNLMWLFFDNNRLTGEIPPVLGTLKKLQSLYLSNNNLRGTIPSSLGNLSSLSALELSLNKLVGVIPDSLGNLKNLAFLALFNNNLSGIIPTSIFNLSSLWHIELGANHLEGSLPTDFGNKLPDLQYFSIQSNQISGHIPSSISNCSKLDTLQFTYNLLQGQVPPLQNLNRLTRLVLSNNLLGIGQSSDLDFVSSLENATLLQVFEIGDNNLTGTFPRSICNFSELQLLELLSNRIVGEIPNCMEKLVKLRVFSALGNRISGVIPEGIGKLQKLVQLDLSENQLSGHIPSSIGNLTNLNLLQLYANNLEGHIPSTVENLKSMYALDLSLNRLSGMIPSQIFGLSSLSVALYLYGNDLTGSLSEDIGKLTNLNSLYLDRNKLSGEIPTSLGSCVELETLNLQGNLFRGIIPDALKTIQGIRVLDLSQNNLSGNIPEFLAHLKLQMLNLSYNNFEGRIPSGGVFNNASGISVVGNSKLCGGIPELQLPKCNNDNVNKNKPNHSRVILAILLSCLGVVLLIASLAAYILCNNKTTKGKTGDSENVANLSYQSILKATDGFSSENLIGKGSFGTIYKGKLGQDGTIVAIKIFNLEHHGAYKSFIAECEILRNFRHRNLLKVITACSSTDYQGNEFKALVYEYMANGSLEDWLHSAEISDAEATSNATRNLSFCKRLDIAVDIAFALEYLHHQCGASVVHCDLKPSNVLLDDDMITHVGDFGLSKILYKDINNSHPNQSISIGVRGTVGYAPPEYGLGNEVSTYGDVYSFGILLLEMFTGKRPTNDIFKGCMSLHEFVKSAGPENVTEIIDQSLVADFSAEDNSYSNMLEALIAALEIGLSCSLNLPRQRMDIRDAAIELSSITKKLNKTRSQKPKRELLLLAGIDSGSIVQSD